MLPYLLAVAGGYLIGNAMETPTFEQGGILDWSNDENEKLGKWLLRNKDGKKIWNDSKSAIELEKNVRKYAEKNKGVAGLEMYDEDEGLEWVTFEDLYREVKSRLNADGGMMAKGGRTDIEMTAWKLPISYNKNKEVIYGEPIILKKGTEKELLKFLDNEKYVKDNRDIFDGRSGVVMFPSTVTLEQVKKYHRYAY